MKTFLLATLCALFLFGCYTYDALDGPDAGLTDIAERDQAPDLDKNTSPDELPMFQRQPDTAELFAAPPGSICGADIQDGPECVIYYNPAYYCSKGSTCNDSPNSCAAKCNYGYVCTANCTSGSPTLSSSQSGTCNNAVYYPKTVDGTDRFYHPGADLKCGTADDPTACAADGKNPGADGLCGVTAGSPENADNY